MQFMLNHKYYYYYYTKYYWFGVKMYLDCHLSSVNLQSQVKTRVVTTLCIGLRFRSPGDRVQLERFPHASNWETFPTVKDHQ